MRAKSKADTRWSEFVGDVYPVRIMLFIGSRKEMVESIGDAFAKYKGTESKETRKEFVENIRSQFGSQESTLAGECGSVVASNGLKLWIVRLAKFDRSVGSMVILSHECLHAALSVLDFCGVSENPPFEGLCYTHEAIFKTFLLCAMSHIGGLEKQTAKQSAR